LEGSLHSSTIAKVIGALIGYITRASVAEAACTGGRASVSQELLPWREQYDGFEGTLPAFTRVNRVVLGNGIRLFVNGVWCRYDAVAGNGFSIVLIRNTMTNRVTMVSFSGQVNGELLNPPGCPSVAIAARSEGTETVLGSTASITLTLI